MRYALENIVSRLDQIDESMGREILTAAHSMHEIITSNSSGLRTQVIHGDLAYYNVIARPGKNGRPNVVGVIDFGDVAVSWVVGDIVIAIVPLLVSEERDCVLQAVDVVTGYLAEASTISQEEALCIWPLIVMRAILLYVTVADLVSQDSNNQYLCEETILNKTVLERVLAVPMYLAQAAILRAAKRESTTPVKAAIAAAAYGLPDGTRICTTIDLSTVSSLYESKKGVGVDWKGGVWILHMYMENVSL